MNTPPKKKDLNYLDISKIIYKLNSISPTTKKHQILKMLDKIIDNIEHFQRCTKEYDLNTDLNILENYLFNHIQRDNFNILVFNKLINHFDISNFCNTVGYIKEHYHYDSNKTLNGRLLYFDNLINLIENHNLDLKFKNKFMYNYLPFVFNQKFYKIIDLDKEFNKIKYLIEKKYIDNVIDCDYTFISNLYKCSNITKKTDIDWLKKIQNFVNDNLIINDFKIVFNTGLKLMKHRIIEEDTNFEKILTGPIYFTSFNEYINRIIEIQD